MQHLKHGPGLILALLFALIGLAACGSSTSTPAATPTVTASSVAGDFVGVTNKVDFLGLSTNGQQLIAYACDGTPKHAITFSTWFTGVVSHNMANLTAANGSHLVTTWTAQAASGTVTLSNGHSFPFTAHAVTDTTGPGLYRGEETIAGVRYLGGWIILPQQTETPSAASSAFAEVSLLSGSLNSLLPEPTGPNPEHGAGIINEHTGALLAWPALTAQDVAARRVTVPNLGTFTMTLCQQGQC